MDLSVFSVHMHMDVCLCIRMYPHCTQSRTKIQKRIEHLHARTYIHMLTHTCKHSYVKSLHKPAIKYIRTYVHTYIHTCTHTETLDKPAIRFQQKHSTRSLAKSPAISKCFGAICDVLFATYTVRGVVASLNMYI